MASLEEEIRALRGEYLQDAWMRLAELDQLLSDLDREPADREILTQVMRRFHGFAGSGSTHGFTRVTELGREAEIACHGWLERSAAPGPKDRSALQALARLIAQELGPSPDARTPTTH